MQKICLEASEYGISQPERYNKATPLLRKQAPELNGSSLAMLVCLQVRDAQQYMRNWHSTVSSVQEHYSRQQQQAALSCPPPALRSAAAASHHLPAAGVENGAHSTPAVSLHHTHQPPQDRIPASASLPSTVVYSTTVNVPQSPAHGSAEPQSQRANPEHANTAAHVLPSDSHQLVYSGAQQPGLSYHVAAGHLQCTCGAVNCTERPRMPFADATNAPFAAGTVPQPAMPHMYGVHRGQLQPCTMHGVPSQPCAVNGVHAMHPYIGHPGSYSSSWNSRNDSLGHESEDSGDRYKSSALERMQRMQV